MATMRAARLYLPKPIGESPLVTEQVPIPEPGPKEVRVRVRACGICHTDLHQAEGELPMHRQPVIPGHQIVGVIDALGEEVDADLLEQRVGVPWLSQSCGDCALCRSGRENLCRRARFTGYDVDGGYAEWAVVPALAAHPLPPELSDAEAAPLLCAGVIGYRSLRLSEVQPGQRLGLFGFGASAHLVIQVARHQDCEVFVFTRSHAHRDLARRLGAAWVGGSEDDPPAELDAAISFAPVGSVARDALSVLGPGGTLAINAVHLDGLPPLDYQRHLYGERTLRSVTNLTHDDAREFLALAAEIGVRTTIEIVTLEEANETLQRMKASEIEAAAVIEL